MMLATKREKACLVSLFLIIIKEKNFFIICKN